MIVRVTTAARKNRDGINGVHSGPGPWLDLIHEVNRLAPGTFGEPVKMGQVEGRGYVEEYAAADVVMFGDDPDVVTIISKSGEASRLITEAATNLSLSTEEV